MRLQKLFKTNSDYSQRGFTLVELLIASSVFSFILLGASAALIQIGRMYYKGVISSQTQGTTRMVIDDISRSIQFSGDDSRVVGTGPVDINIDSDSTITVQAICIGNTRYTFTLNAQVNDQVGGYESDTNRIPHALWRDYGSCIAEGDDGIYNLPDLTNQDLVDEHSSGQELLEQHMRLASFSVTTSGSDLYSVQIKVIYGDSDLLAQNDDGSQTCVGSVLGGQWCAVSELSTTVFKRIGIE